MKTVEAPYRGFSIKAHPEGSITQYFGENPLLYSGCCNLAGHNGIDCVAPHGTPLFALTKQKVVEVKHDAGGYGKHIKCIDDQFEYTYGHLAEIFVEVGQILEEGQEYGLMGNTGFVVSGATPYWEYNPYKGTHWHLTLRQFKPYAGGATWSVTYPTGDKGDILNYNDGYKGAVDPLKHLSFGTLTDAEAIRGIWLTIASLKNWMARLLAK